MSFWDDIKHFKPSEFDSPDMPGSGEMFMDEDFVRVLDAIRAEADFPMVVSRGGGYRTHEYNKKVYDPKPPKNSQHLYGKAADIKVGNGFQRASLVKLGLKHGLIGFGVYDKHVHLDARDWEDEVMWPGTSK